MPTRTASMTKRIAANGQALHRAATARKGTAAQEPSEAEAALLEERKQLKEEREKRKAQALLPRPSALDRLVRTHHPQAKEKAAKKDTHHDDAKKPKARKTRAEKHAEKAAALEAARRSPKKPAK
jgi:hypothetical protein